MNERIEAMEALARQGWTLERIGEAFDLTRERVRQLISIPKQERGVAILSKDKQRRRIAALDANKLRIYGCSKAVLMQINGGQPLSRHNSPVGQFAQQRKSAKQRRIPWRLTLPQWWAVWQESGKWDQRGRGKGKYCMSRKGDLGAYEVGNVEIVTHSENSSSFYDNANRRSKRDEIGLTPRERLIYDLRELGIGPKAIAEQLGIKQGTVNTMLCHIKRHLRLSWEHRA